MKKNMMLQTAAIAGIVLTLTAQPASAQFAGQCVATLILNVGSPQKDAAPAKNVGINDCDLTCTDWIHPDGYTMPLNGGQGFTRQSCNNQAKKATASYNLEYGLYDIFVPC